MTLGSVTLRYNALTTEGSDSSHSSISSIPASKFNDEISSVIKISTVKVRFTQQNSNIATWKNDHIAASPTEEAAKLAEEEEHYCCGVRWPPSRIPLAAYSNNRCRISLSRNTRTNEERRNFTRSPVRYCTSEWIQQVPHVRPSLTDCFGRRNFKSKKCDRNDIECEPCAVLDTTDSSRSSSSTSYCKRGQKNVFESAIVCSRESDCSIYNCDKRSLISYCEEPSTDSTLDRFQKFGFGGDRVKKNAGRRGSGGNHKKKTQRSSDKTINLKKLTDKLIQSSSHRSDHENNAEPESSSNAAAVTAEPPKPIQELIPLKLNPDEKVNDKDDIFEGVNLNLAKPESRTIVGSYYQRSIPFRSASFSQVHYSPEDRKYIRNSRKIGVSKKNIPNAADNCATLPRTNASALSIADENYDSHIDVDNTNSFLSNYTFVGESKTAATSEPPCSNETETQNEPVGNEGNVPTEQPKPLSNELPESVSLIELEPAVPLKATITPINAPEFDKPIPQAPKRSKHKHKHRHRHCGRLYFSDENIFLSNITDEGCKQDTIENSENLPEILPVIRTAPNSDTEMEKEPSSPAPVAEIISESIETADKPTFNDEPDKFDNENSSGIEMFVTDWTEKEKSNETVSVVEEEPPSDQSKLINETPTEEKSAPSLNIDNNNNAHSNENVDMFHCQTTPSSPEEMLKPQWPIVPRNRRLTPQTSTEKDDESESYSPRKYLYSRGDSFSETESDQGDKRSVSPGHREGRLSPLTYGNPELSDSDSRSVGTPRGPQSPVPYSKRPLRGPYLEMIVNEQKRPENKTSFAELQFLENRNPQNANWCGNSDRAVDDYYLRRSNTSPNSNKLNVVSLPKRKISANIPFSSSASLRTTTDEKGVIHHQRTTSSPSQLEYYPDLLNNAQHGSMPSQQLLHQLLRGSSERSLVQDVGVDSLKNMYPAPTYKDTRSHIVVELYDTEHSYVESLQILVTKYLQPLKSPEFSSLIEPATVQEIFYQIPEILAYHEDFLKELRVRLEGWNRGKCIGDIFLETFTKESVVDSYIAFINNWKSAKEAIKQTCHMKPAFAKFLEAMAKEHKGKLALDSLLIMPVQRIPRYELLIQSLIKHTEVCHPDFEKLQQALHQVHELAVRINCTERENLELEQIENLIDGLGNLVSADRQFLRYDLVSMNSGQGLSRKERALFLFNDLLIITSVKRRSSTVKKPLSSSPGSIASSLEANKYKLLMKIPLEHLDIVKVKDDNLRRIMKEMEFLSEDVNTLSQMSDLVSSLHCPHSQLEESIREMLGALNKQLNERHSSESQLSYLELALSTRNSIENISAVFPKPEKRTSWEETFLEAKARLNVSGDRRLCPEFLTSVPIRKTRAGLQFTCATAAYNQQDVWVCNSDGFVGQVCILSLHPEPAVTSCNGVCNARILSVTSVPVSRIIEKFNADAQTNSVKGDSYEEVNESIPLDNNEGDIPDIHLDSSSSSDDEDGEEELSIEELKITDNSNSENGDSTMWLGTEDGYIYIFNCTDSLRVKRNKQKYKHNSAVYCILYHDKNVFVSLADGEVHVYSWSPVSGWNLTDPVTIIRVGCKTTPALRMLLVCGKLWCICHNIIKVISFQTLKVENSFTFNENNRAITAVAVFGYGVWLSLQNSAMLRVVHAISCEILAEVNVTQAVTKMLSGTDDIIRQHKSACLRVTALLTCKDLLWIGTSAGVVLTMSLPVVKRDTTKLNNIQPPIGVPHGHTGQVRFLTSVKCTKNYNNARRSSKAASKKSDRTKASKMLVISGGDGYEDFRSNSVPEVSGREDSTNHLLIWRV